MRKIVDGVVVEMTSKESVAFTKQQTVDTAEVVVREMTPAELVEARLGMTVDDLTPLVEAK